LRSLPADVRRRAGCRWFAGFASASATGRRVPAPGPAFAFISATPSRVGRGRGVARRDCFACCLPLCPVRKPCRLESAAMGPSADEALGRAVGLRAEGARAQVADPKARRRSSGGARPRCPVDAGKGHMETFPLRDGHMAAASATAPPRPSSPPPGIENVARRGSSVLPSSGGIESSPPMSGVRMTPTPDRVSARGTSGGPQRVSWPKTVAVHHLAGPRSTRGPRQRS
jgi:hypothetical protein